MHAVFHKLHPQALLFSEGTWYACAFESVAQLSGIVLLIALGTLDLSRYAHWNSKQQKDATRNRNVHLLFRIISFSMYCVASVFVLYTMTAVMLVTIPLQTFRCSGISPVLDYCTVTDA
jgi:amino acid transporter